MLTNSQIKHELFKKRLIIDPLDPNDIQPASVDLHLGTAFRMFDDREVQEIDPYRLNGMGFPVPSVPDMLVTDSKRGLRLAPGHFVLGHTLERIKLSEGLLGRLEGKSSLGRLGLAVHITAGFFDPGWDGQATLELYNFSPHVWVLRPGMPICQMAFDHLIGIVDRPYGQAGNHYQGSEGVIAARIE